MLKGGTNVQMADDSVESATAMLELIADLAGKGDFYVSLSSALFEGMVKDPFDWYVMSKTVNSLSDSTDQQLIALKSASANLSRNVQTLQEQKLAVAACEKLAKGPSVKDMSRSQYELERKRLYALVLQALDVVSACRAKWQSCWNSCTSQPNPSADKCWQKCGNCDADQASWDTAMQRVYAFDKEWSASH